MKNTKDLNYYKNNCEEDYINTPISVLRYITELEQSLQLQQTCVSSSLLLDDSELKRLIWEEWEGEIKEEDPRQMVLKYMKMMRSEFVKQ